MVEDPSTVKVTPEGSGLGDDKDPLTEESGTVFILNVPEGLQVVNAVEEASGQAVSTADLRIRSGELAWFLLFPSRL